MTTEIIFITAAIFVFTGFWWFGHMSSWGKLHNSYDPPRSSTMSKTHASYINISLLKNRKFIGGGAIKLYLNKDGALFESIALLKYLIPSFFIPWHEVKNINTNNTKGFLHRKRTEISLINHNISILIPSGSLTSKLLSYIDENGIK